MSSLHYFFPDCGPMAGGKVPPCVAKSSPLHGANWTTNFPSGGPEGSSGCCITIIPDTPEGKESTFGYRPDQQHWTSIHTLRDGEYAEKPSYWIGFEIDNPPTPADLLRKNSLGGWPVRLGDGLTYDVPILLANRTSLPQSVKVVKGEMFFQVRRQYQSLVDRSARWWKWYQESKNEDNHSPNDAEWFQFTCDLLAVNYRLGPEEVSALSLIDLGMEVIHAALGIPILMKEIEEREKKESQEKAAGIAPNG